MEDKKIREKWDQLESYKPKAGNGFVKFFSTFQYGESFFGLDSNRQLQFYVRIGNQPLTHFILKSLKGIRCESGIYPEIDPKTRYLKLTALNDTSDFDGLPEAFRALTTTLSSRLSTAKSESEAVDIVDSVFRKYENFFKAGGETTLTEAEEQGLFGELFSLNRLVKFKDADVVQAWEGPNHSRHDFCFDNGSDLEIKTSLKLNQVSATISDIQQLQNASEKPLYLLLYQLEKKESGLGICDLVTDIFLSLEGHIEDQKCFEQKLIQCKINPKNVIAKRRYVIVAEHYYKVEGAFPRLTTEGIATVSSRITNVKYEINLNGYPEMEEKNDGFYARVAI